jgi:hypothetical protein
VNPLALALWGAGVAMVVLAILRVRGPQSRLAELDRLAENAQRYESWRGGRKTAAGGDGESGADVMRAMLRRQVRMWIVLGVLGVGLLVAGFVAS